MTVQEALNEFVRVELVDKELTRWENADLLVFFKQAARRMNAIGLRNEFPFMRAYVDQTVAAGIDQIVIPNDFFSPIGIWRTDRHSKIKHSGIDEFESIISTCALSHWIIEGTKIMFKGSADVDIPIRLRYFVDYKPQSLTLASQVPWDDKLTMIMCDYVKIRAKNVDEYQLNEDMMLLQDLETQILNAYGNLNPETADAVGVFNL